MTKTTVGIEGMVCPMCEAHINDVIRRSFPVRSAKADRRRKRCVIVSEQPLDEAALRAAISSTGYEVTSFSSEPHKRWGTFGSI